MAERILTLCDTCAEDMKIGGFRVKQMKEVPVIRLDHLSDEERREYALLHNKTAELSVWDFDALAMELSELDLSEFDMACLRCSSEQKMASRSFHSHHITSWIDLL